MRNKKKLPLLICTALMTVVMLIGAFSSVLSAATGANLGSSPYIGRYEGDLSFDRSQFYNGTSILRLPTTVRDDDDLSLIVKMNGKSLLDAYDSANTDLEFSEYYLTDEADELKREIEANATDYKAILSEKNVSYTAGDVYSTIFDGFEITVKARDFVNVCKLLGDDVTVIVGEVYEPADTQLVENNVNAFDTGIFDTTGFGYDGTGTIVAVLDTGLDYYHTAFSPSNFGAAEGSWALTFDEVAALIGDTAASGMHFGLTASDVYLNGKVPFGFDYADSDPDVFPIQSNHGTHVAGIIAGKDDKITGVAPNAQLAIMKVFSDIELSARSAWILSALEDCVVLGVDVINMSLGSGCGFSRESDKELISGVYDDIRARGISLICAASNSYSSAYASEKNGNLPLTSNPDVGTVGSPSTYKGALCVASIEGAKTSYLLYGDRIIYYTESSDRSAEEKHFVEELLGEVMEEIDIEYVTIPGSGIEADYIGLDVSGKIALIRRGTSTFEEKANTAEKMGAAGAIIYNNVSGEIRMNVGETKIPVCSISQDDGEALAAHATGKIRISYNQKAGPFMSGFSSWGPTPDLKIKPEITAHGGSILSAVPGQDYDRLSGTSMACPNMAGVAALLREYVKKNFPSDVASDPVKVTAAVNRLLMSTADIIYNKNGNPYSIRKQGAGLANLINCKNTTAYILTYDREDGSVQDKSKIELGDDPTKSGVYTLVFTIDNFGSDAVSYDVSAIVLTEGVSDTFTSHGETTVTETAELLSGATVTVTSVDGGVQNGSNVTVEGGKLATVTVTITLGDEDKKYLDESFENGMYVEGFVTLDATGSTAVDLNVPYLAFYGDWTEAPLFDIDYFETNKDELDDSIDLLDKTLADAYATRPVGGLYDDYISYLGGYYYQQKPGSNMISADRKYISLTNQENGVNYLYGVWAGLLRNAAKVDIVITEDSTGEVIFERTETDERKSYGDGGSIYPAGIDIDFHVSDYNLKNNATYTVTLTGYLDYGDGGISTNDKNTFTFPMTIDFEAPTLTGCEFYTEYDKSAKKNRLYAKMAVYDNHYSMSALVGYVGYDPDLVLEDGTVGGYTISSFDRYMTPVYSDKNSTSYVIYELTDYVDDIKAGSHNNNTFVVSLYDYALNEATYEVALPMEYIDLYYEQTEITLSPNQTYDLKPIVYPSTEWGELVDYTSTKPDVARVVNNKIIATGSGEAVIYASVTLEDGTTKQQKLYVKVLAEGEEGYKKFTKPVTDSFTLESYYVNKAYYFLGSDERDLGLDEATMQFVGDYYALKMFPSESVTINYQLHAYFPEDTEVVFSSSNDSIVKVDEKGTITAVKEGYASISVKVLMDGASTYYSKSISIEVKDPYVTNGPWLMHYYGNGGIVSIPASLGLTEIYQYAFSNYEYIPKDENDEISEEDPSTTKIWYIGDDTIEEVIIPEGVETIGPYAFANLTKLKKVTLPSTLTKIDKGAFYGCTALTSVVGIENVKFINQNAFTACELGGTLALNSAVAVADYAFYCNRSLTSVVCSKDLQSIGAYAFAENTSLTSINIAAEKIKLGQFAFSGCKELSTASINASVISAGAFNDCKALTLVDIGPDVAVIGEHAFRNTAVTAFRVNESNTTFKPVSDQPYILNAAGNEILLVSPAIKELVLNDSNITSVANGAFSGNANLTKVSIPSVTSVGNYAFAECTSLSDLTLGTLTHVGDYAFDSTAIRALPSMNVTRIGSYAFANSYVESVNISDGVTVGEGAFTECKLLTSVRLGNDVVVEDYAFSFNLDRNYGTVGFFNDAAGRVYYLQYASPISTITIGNNATLGNGAFWGAAEVTSITLGNGAYIGDYAFYNTCALKSIDLSAATHIGNFALSGDVLYTFRDQSLTEYAVDENLYYIFRYYASKLESIDLSAAEFIGEDAFSYSHELKSVKLGDGITSIPNGAFRDCRALGSINLDKITSIGEYAFASTLLTSVDLSGVTSIGEYAFAETAELESVIFAEKTDSIGEGAFSYATKLNSVTNLGGVVSVGDYAFAYTDLSEADLTSAEYLGMHAFLKDKETSKAFTVKLGTALKQIGDNPFAYCTLAPFSNIEKEEFNGVTYEKTVYTFDLGDNVRVIDGSLYRVVPTGLELVVYCGESDKAVVAEGTVRVSAFAFANTNITSVSLPYTLKAIGHKAFYDCAALKLVSFSSFVAPVLEEEYDMFYFYSFENLPTAPDYDGAAGGTGLGIVDYFVWNIASNPSNLFYGANFVDYIGHISDKIVMVKPVNGQQYDTFILNQYFDVIVDGAAAADDITLEAIAAIDRIPEKVTLADKPIVEAARAAYARISTNEQKALVKNYQKLEAAEKQITKLEYLENDQPPVDDPVITDPVKEFPTLAVVLICVGAVILLAGAGAFVYFFVLRGKLKKSGEATEAANETEADEADANDSESDNTELDATDATSNSEETSEDNND